MDPCKWKEVCLKGQFYEDSTGMKCKNSSFLSVQNGFSRVPQTKMSDSLVFVQMNKRTIFFVA